MFGVGFCVCHKLSNTGIRSGRRGRYRCRNVKGGIVGLSRPPMSGNLGFHGPPEASVEVPNCKPDTFRAELLPHLLRGSDHALQPIYFLKRMLGRCSPQIKSDDLLHISECTHVLSYRPPQKTNSVQHDRRALAHSLGVFYISTRS